MAEPGCEPNSQLSESTFFSCSGISRKDLLGLSTGGTGQGQDEKLGGTVRVMVFLLQKENEEEEPIQ